MTQPKNLITLYINTEQFVKNFANTIKKIEQDLQDFFYVHPTLFQRLGGDRELIGELAYQRVRIKFDNLTGRAIIPHQYRLNGFRGPNDAVPF